MPMDRDVLESALHTAFPQADITIKDLAGDNDHWSVNVVCPSFAGKTRIAQHKAVYAALGGAAGNELHALQVNTSAPAST